MMYPFVQLNDNTEIVHSEILEGENGGEKVKVYIETPIDGGFKSAVCYLPEYEWEEITGFTDEEISTHLKFLKSTAHLIIQFAREGGFDDAADF